MNECGEKLLNTNYEVVWESLYVVKKKKQTCFTNINIKFKNKNILPIFKNYFSWENVIEKKIVIA